MSGAASVFVLGKGTVASALFAQLHGLQRGGGRASAAVRLVGAADRRGSWFDAGGGDPRAAVARLDAARAGEGLAATIDRLRSLPTPILVDCTAADGMERAYERALGAGVHVVTANKKPLAIPASARARLFAAAARAGRALRYETTVGASLPVIETLQNLIRTGDRVDRIEGSLSGTLGYLAGELARGVPLSRAVASARVQGLTEPHPRDDLSGVDVARKALILAREIGLEVELSEVSIEPFVPASILAHETPEALLTALERYDPLVVSQMEELRRRGEVLRYLATIEPASTRGPAQVRVGPVGVPEQHPAARLRGTEALVSFRTERFSAHPLVVQGPGAGGALTAAGVLADLLGVTRGNQLDPQLGSVGRARASRSCAGVLPNQRTHAR